MRSLEVEGVSLRFGALNALREVSLQIDEGELVGMIGPNGAGKTTFFNVLSGHYAPNAGRVKLDGRRIEGLPPWKVARAGVARTFQNPRLFKTLSCRQNVAAGINPSGLRAWVRPAKSLRAVADEWLDFVGLSDLAEEKAGSLSYGYLRRLEIARACARQPRLLLLDEPAAGMNAAERADLMDLIQRVNALGSTVLLIEHNMALVLGMCPRVAVLNFGQLIAVGSPDEIRNDPMVVDAYLGAESEDEDDRAKL
jgi:branched-chain amino acid transport system ATP-binding protein